MESRKNESKQSPDPRKEAKESRFRIVKLEERIAPGSANTHGMQCNLTLKCSRGDHTC
jgi:hypothetical protein